MRISEKGDDNGRAYEKAGESLDAVRVLVEEVLGENLEMVVLSSSLSETKKLNEKGIGRMRLNMLPQPEVYGLTVQRFKSWIVYPGSCMT